MLLGRGRADFGDLASFRRGGGLTRDVAGQGKALTMLILDGGRGRVQPQEEKGLQTQEGEGHG